MVLNWRGQRRLSPEELGALVLANDVHHVVGATATKLTRPSTDFDVLVLIADKGAFRVRAGDHVASGMPSTVDPAASVTDGTGALKIPEGMVRVLTAPADVTVRGYNSTDVLTYFYV